MYKRTLLVFPLLIGIIMGGSVENNNSDTSDNENPLVGTWRQLGQCQSNEVENTSSDAYIIFTNNIAAITIKNFSGLECDNNELLDHKVITYQYTRTEEAQEKPSANALDFTLIDVSNRKGEPSKAYLDTHAGFYIEASKLYIVDKENRDSEEITNHFDNNIYWIKQ